MADWAEHGWAAAEGSVPGSALSPVATAGLGSQRPLGAGQSCLDGPKAGHRWPLGWEVPSPGSHPLGSGPWAQDPLQELCPHGLRRQQCLVGTWALPQEGEMFLEHRLCACALAPGRQSCGPQMQCLISLCASLSSVKQAQPPLLPQRLPVREKVTMHAIKCSKQWLSIHRK